MVFWGHPSTTGLPSIDYFVSSAAAEPADADAHYSEKLVRLPGLGVRFTPQSPPSVASREVELASFGLAHVGVASERVYLCAQSLFKVHPSFDEAVEKVLSE